MRIGTLLSALVFGVAVLFGAQNGVSSAKAAKVTAKIDISSQRMHVYQNGRRIYSWPVSTGRGRYRTPNAGFRARMTRPQGTVAPTVKLGSPPHGTPGAPGTGFVSPFLVSGHRTGHN